MVLVSEVLSGIVFGLVAVSDLNPYGFHQSWGWGWFWSQWFWIFWWFWSWWYFCLHGCHHGGSSSISSSCPGVGSGLGSSSPPVTPPTLIPTFTFTPSPLNQKSESTLGWLLWVTEIPCLLQTTLLTQEKEVADSVWDGGLCQFPPDWIGSSMSLG